MSDIDFRTLNLNLLPALSTLLDERAVGRAAHRMGVSQSAMSHSLARLRELLDDPLLVPQGRGMALTPRAKEIAAALPAALEHLRDALTGPSDFVPRTAEATFTIATFDYFELTTLPSLLAHLAAHAPAVRLHIQRLTPASFVALREGEIDVILGGPAPAPAAGIRGLELYRDPFKVIARHDHPGVGRRLTLQAYLAYEHVLVRLEGRSEGAVDRALARHGYARRVGLSVPHFIGAPLAVARSDMLSTLAGGVASQARALLGVRMFEPPIEVPAAPITMWWPRAHDTDPARTWFRELLQSGVAAPPFIRRLMRSPGPPAAG